MPPGFLLHAPIGLTPVLLFLGALVWFDSYKLIALKTLLGAIGIGGLAAVLSYFANDAAAAALQIDFVPFIRYVSPLIEESLKAAILIYLIRTQRIGLLIDGAIIGFAVGTGFAVVENLYFLLNSPDLAVGVWFIRGFGTAVMHGGATALFAMITLSRFEPGKRPPWQVLLPGFAVAVALHAAFNQFFLSPVAQAAAMAVVVPPLFYVVFQRSERELQSWVGQGFDANMELLSLMNEGRLGESPIGRYLHALRDRFEPLALVDVLCYLRLHTELAIRAKGLLMLREQGMDVPLDEESRSRLTELDTLERTVGKAAMLSIRPMLNLGAREVWQLRLLER